MKQSLVQKMKGRRFAALLVAGDLTGKASPTEFVECKALVDEIATSLNVGLADVFATFGNHDINWPISKLSEAPEDTADPLYGEAAALLGPHFARFGNCAETGPVPGSGIFEREDFVVYLANSGSFDTHNQKYHHGMLGKEQMKWLSKVLGRTSNRSKWHILLVHHHPFKYSYPKSVEDISCLEEGSELVDLLGTKGVDLVCHGHRHHPKLFTLKRSDMSAPVTFLCAGSLGADVLDRSMGEIPNLFHVVSLDSRDNDQAACGSVETLQYFSPDGWVPGKKSVWVPLDPLHYFGSVASDTERRTAIKQVIDEMMTIAAEDVLDMPTLPALPYCLRCLPCEELNDLLQCVASQEFTYRVLGAYPDAVVLQKVKS